MQFLRSLSNLAAQFITIPVKISAFFEQLSPICMGHCFAFSCGRADQNSNAVRGAKRCPVTRWNGCCQRGRHIFGTRARAAAGCNSSSFLRSRPARLLDSVKKRLGLARVNEETGRNIVSKKGGGGSDQGLENAAGECFCWFTGA